MEEFKDDRFREEELEQEELREYEEYVDLEAEHELEVKQKLDEFLDTYGVYLNTQNDFNKNMLKRKTIELEVLDPDFQFDIE